LLPANTAYGKLPEQVQTKGVLRVQTSPEHEQTSFIKFPVSSIKSQDTVIGATLRVHKDGGAEGPVIVKVASCSWSRDTITYTNSQDYAGDTISEGSGAVFPEANNVWVAVSLNAAAVQKARLSGDHVCIQVSGGPAEAPVVFSSEMTTKQPELKVMVQKNVPEQPAEAVLRDSNNAPGPNEVHQLDGSAL